MALSSAGVRCNQLNWITGRAIQMHSVHYPQGVNCYSSSLVSGAIPVRVDSSAFVNNQVQYKLMKSISNYISAHSVSRGAYCQCRRQIRTITFLSCLVIGFNRQTESICWYIKAAIICCTSIFCMHLNHNKRDVASINFQNTKRAFNSKIFLRNSAFCHWQSKPICFCGQLLFSSKNDFVWNLPP